MTKAERIAIIQQLLDAGQTEEEIKDYLVNEAKWDLKSATIDKYISEAKNAEVSEDEEPEEDSNTDNAGDQDSNDNSEKDNQEGNAQGDQDPGSEENEESEEDIVESIKSRIRDGEEADDLKEEFKGRLVARAKGQIDLEAMEEKAREQQKDKDAFEKKINKHLKPAQKALKTALAEIEQIKKLKRKENKNSSRFAAAEKLITRILKNQLSRP